MWNPCFVTVISSRQLNSFYLVFANWFRVEKHKELFAHWWIIWWFSVAAVLSNDVLYFRVANWETLALAFGIVMGDEQKVDEFDFDAFAFWRRDSKRSVSLALVFRQLLSQVASPNELLLTYRCIGCLDWIVSGNRARSATSSHFVPFQWSNMARRRLVL